MPHNGLRLSRRQRLRRRMMTMTTTTLTVSFYRRLGEDAVPVDEVVGGSGVDGGEGAAAGVDDD